MKRLIFILVGLVIVGGLAFAGYKYYQNRQEEITNLNKMKASLTDNREDVYDVEAELRNIVLTLNHTRDLILIQDMVQPEKANKIAATGEEAFRALLSGQPAAAMPADPARAWLSWLSVEQKKNLYWWGDIGPPPLEASKYFFNLESFQSKYRQYKNLIFSYNNRALEINFIAERLGEPPVLLLEAYEPDIK